MYVSNHQVYNSHVKSKLFQTYRKARDANTVIFMLFHIATRLYGRAGEPMVIVPPSTRPHAVEPTPSTHASTFLNRRVRGDVLGASNGIPASLS